MGFLLAATPNRARAGARRAARVRMGQRAGGEAAARRYAVAACPGLMSTFV
jgi:hypothetical protein